MPKPPPEPPPPPPEVKVVQIKCVPWKTMDFQLEVQLPYLSIAELETFIKARHGDPIDNLVLFKDDPRDPANKLAAASEEKLDKVGTAIFYDYYPPHDPFCNRPTAPEVYAANPLIKTSCTQEYEGQPPEPKVEKPRPPMPEGPIPPRVKGAARSVFLGPTSKEYFGLSTLTKDFPYALVPKEMILSEIKEKGKISDMYVLKADVEAYDGADGQILFCMDRDEVYSDEGMVWCAKEAEKINFMASIAQGNGLPPPM
eukprot:jgi/Chrpa1/9418/Chrysochromulina_OHIO_Genome00013176-RA